MSSDESKQIYISPYNTSFTVKGELKKYVFFF